MPFIKEIITNSEKQFLVVHTSGSHWNYNARYPKEFERFTPTCPIKVKGGASDCDKLELVNSYDNSILYTDFII